MARMVGSSLKPCGEKRDKTGTGGEGVPSAIVAGCPAALYDPLENPVSPLKIHFPSFRRVRFGPM